MRNFYILITAALFLSLAGFALTQESSLIVFPVPELGNCPNEEECKIYCDKPENMEACLDFAEAHGLISQEDIDIGRKMLEAGLTGGPGNCQGQTECEAYCNIPEHMEECIVFTIEHDLVPSGELEELEGVLQAIRAGAVPPPCQGRIQCDEYCSQPENIEVCVDFGVAAGFISSEEAEMIRRTGGRGPGGCMGREECDAFCEDPNNMQICIEFGIEHGLMPLEELEEAKMMLEAIKKGVKPPSCQSKEECDKYCSTPEHAQECVDFAVAAGFMSSEEAEQAKKMMAAGLMAGPGNCQGKEECEAFCDNPDNMVECVNFAEKAGFMTPEEAAQARKMAELGITGGPGGCQGEKECKAFCDNPVNEKECFEFGVKAGFISPEEAEKMRAMQQIRDRGGPGGCKSKEECESYCNNPDHVKECMEFAEREGFMDSKEAEQGMRMIEMEGPVGCTSKEECEKYCFEHPQECGIKIPMPSPENIIIPESQVEPLPPKEEPVFPVIEPIIPPIELEEPIIEEPIPLLPKTEPEPSTLEGEAPQTLMDITTEFLANLLSGFGIRIR